MRSTPRLRGALCALLTAGALVCAPSAFAHPEACHKDETHDAEAYCFSDGQLALFDDSAATLGVGELSSSRNMHLLANLPRSGPFDAPSGINSDIAFWGSYAIQGNYNGFQITDISKPEAPRQVSQVFCPGSQNDVSVWKNLIFTSTDSRRNDDSCNSFALGSSTTPSSTDPTAEYWEGIKIFDWSDPANPRLVKTVETDCGSHTHTLIPDGNRVLLYVSSYDINANAKDCRNTGSRNDHDKISIVEVPLGEPESASVIAEPLLFPDGGYDGSNGYTRETRGCHDITAYPAIGLAAGACMGNGIIMDIRNPAAPVVLSRTFDPEFSFWHSATFSNDGSKVIFTDELGGGVQPMCNPTVGDNHGADAIYDIRNRLAPLLLSYFKIDRTQHNTENCVSHNGIVLPTTAGDVFVQAWYQGGTSVIDFNDPTAPREIGFLERGPVSDTQLVTAGAWSSYWYNGFIYVNDITMGLDVIALSDRARVGTRKQPYLNAQTQEPVR